jgi:hypothetical protein
MKNNIIIDCIVYPFDVFVSFQNYDDFEHTLKKILPKDIHSEIEVFKGNYTARTLKFSNGALAIRFTTKDHGLLAHEVFHATDLLMENIGMKLSRDSDEAYAYLIQYITVEIYDKLWNKIK